MFLFSCAFSHTSQTVVPACRSSLVTRANMFNTTVKHSINTHFTLHPQPIPSVEAINASGGMWDFVITEGPAWITMTLFVLIYTLLVGDHSADGGGEDASDDQTIFAKPVLSVGESCLYTVLIVCLPLCLRWAATGRMSL